MHEQLLEALRGVAKVDLVAAFRDDQLGFPSGQDLRVFLPDMHLCSAARSAAYRYQTNREELLVRGLGALMQLKRDASGVGDKVVVYHIGDYLDLWRESSAPDCDEEVAIRIKRDHLPLVNALEADELETLFLLGNHDFDLFQWHDYAAWDRRYYIPGGNAPSALVMHGDYFDWLENLPERVKDFAVYYFAPHKDPDANVLGQLKDLSYDSHKGQTYTDFLRLSEPAMVGPTQSSDAMIPAAYNVQKPGTPGAADQFFNSAFGECSKANQQYELDMRLVIIGHTHHARIAMNQAPDGRPFVLVDCGAWIEEYREEEKSDPQPNAQIAALSANEVRIYQLGER